MSCRGSKAWSWRCGVPQAGAPSAGCIIFSLHAIAMSNACFLPLKPWRTCGRSCARARRATHSRIPAPSGAGTRSCHARGARLPARARAHSARGRPRDRQDAPGANPRARARRALCPHPVHPRPDAGRHHRYHVAHRGSAVLVPAGAGLRRPRTRGRNQPRAGEDAGRPARGDAGTDRDGGRPEPSAVTTVHRLRHTNPDRVRGYLPLAGGRARSLHGQSADRLSAGGRGAGDPDEVRRRLRGRPHRHLRRRAGDRRRRPRAAATGGRCRTRRAPHHRLHHGDRARHARGRFADTGSEPARRRVALQGRTIDRAARRARRREAARPRDPPASRQRGARARARGCDRRSGAQGNSGPDRGSHGVNPPPMVLAGAVIAAFVGLWYALGTVAGILWTPRALVIAGVLSVLGVAGFWTPWGLDVMLLADLVLIVLVWIDADVAGPVTVSREPLPALSVGHPGEVTYRWTNPSGRRVRLRVREVRPEILGGPQPPRALRIEPRAVGRETVPVVPLRRGRERGGAGGFVLDSIGPLGLGRRRVRVPLPWEVVVYPPLVSVRLRASVAEAMRRREAGTKP